MQHTIPVKTQKLLLALVAIVYWFILLALMYVQSETTNPEEQLTGIAIVVYCQHLVFAACFDTTMYIGPGFGRINNVNEKSRPFRYFLAVLGTLSCLAFMYQVANS